MKEVPIDWLIESETYIDLKDMGRNRPYSTHDVDSLKPMFPRLSQDIIRIMNRGFLISTISLPEYYETMIFPVDFERGEIEEEVLYCRHAKTTEEAWDEHRKAMGIVSRIITPSVKNFKKCVDRIEDNALAKMRETYA